LLWRILPSDAINEGGSRGAAVHAAALMRSFGIVFDEVLIKNGPHLLEGLEPGATALDAETLVEQGAVLALDDAIGLWPVDPGSLALDETADGRMFCLVDAWPPLREFACDSAAAFRVTR
jgi:hypothetical protein